jgi:glucose-6-phosphate isomerase
MQMTQRPEWARVHGLVATAPDLREVCKDAASLTARQANLGCAVAGLGIDLSRQRASSEIIDALLALARASGVEAQRDAMFTGQAVNATEGRAALHVALRAPPTKGADSLGIPLGARELAITGLEAVLAFAESWRTESTWRNVVNIGIGGSDLGPQMAVQALAAHRRPSVKFHFVSNVDPADLLGVLSQCTPADTLFIVASKTFTTQDTMANAALARTWFEAQGGRDVARHFVVVTGNVDAARSFGVPQTFGFADWVGGRYSMWGPIGLSIALAVGSSGFRQMLAGARAVDEHFVTAPLSANAPALLGLVDVWNRNALGFGSRCVVPYAHGLARWPAYLQQLEMESNGKRVSASGETLAYASAPAVWGEPGTNAQHAFFQLLHQGTDAIPVDFVTVSEPVITTAIDALQTGVATQHQVLLASAAAQAQALALGQYSADPHRAYPGNRPSTTINLPRLDPWHLGALVALHEHRVFTASVVWGINPFDQFGVELGKKLCQELLG